MIKAYEIEGCFQVANSFNAVGLDHTIYGQSRLEQLSFRGCSVSRKKQALSALSHAWMDGHPLRTFRAGSNTVARKGWAAGDACMRAVHLAFMTRNGQEGSKNPLTAERWGFYACLFQNKMFSLPIAFNETIIHKVTFKLIVCEGHVLKAAQAALQLSQALHNAGLVDEMISDNIAHIEIRTHRAALVTANKKGKLHNAADRGHCMQYVDAVTLLNGDWIAPRDYDNDSRWASDARVEKLRNTMHLHED